MSGALTQQEDLRETMTQQQHPAVSGQRHADDGLVPERAAVPVCEERDPDDPHGSAQQQRHHQQCRTQFAPPPRLPAGAVAVADTGMPEEEQCSR